MMRRGCCKYFTGFRDLSQRAYLSCGKGVVYRELAGGDDFGWMTRLPCIQGSPLSREGQTFCSLREEPTDAEIEASMAYGRVQLAWVDEAVQKISEGGERQGVIPCPACGCELRFMNTIGARGTRLISGRCATDGCLQWMT